MQALQDLRRTHKRIWFGLWILTLTGVLGIAQWRFGLGDPIRTQVLGASTSIPPTPTIASGPSGTVPSTSATFTYSDTQNNVGFQCKLDGAAYSSCSKNGVTYSGLTAGSHTFSVVAQQGNGPLSPPAGRTWTVVVPPPAPTITARPASTTIEPDATFAFTGQAGVTFDCSLDGATFAACTSPKSYEGLAAGSHTFSVRAVSGPATSTATSASWTISSAGFGISGNLDAALYPGRTVPLNLVFTNPYSAAQGLDITGVTVTVQHGNVPGCDGPQNVAIASSAPGFTPAWPVNIPRNATRSLAQLNIPSERWPQVTMLNLPTNQDACKNATFRFTYTGTATK